MTESSVLVSVIVPFHNAQSSIRQTIESVLNQTLSVWELILIDDGSTDSSLAVANGFKHPSLHVISKTNGGVSSARNLGLSWARGDFVFFLDADDVLRPACLETMIRHAADSDWVVGNFGEIDPARKVVRSRVPLIIHGNPSEASVVIFENTQEWLLSYHEAPEGAQLITASWNKLFRRSILEEHKIRFPVDMPYSEDFVFNLKYLRHAGKTVLINEATMDYTVSYDGLSFSPLCSDELLYVEERLYEELVETFSVTSSRDPQSIENLCAGYFVYHVIAAMVRSCRNGQPKDEIRKLIESPVFRARFRHYRRKPGQSRVIPLLIRMGAVAPLLHFCHLKARQRFN